MSTLPLVVVGKQKPNTELHTGDSVRTSHRNKGKCQSCEVTWLPSLSTLSSLSPALPIHWNLFAFVWMGGGRQHTTNSKGFHHFFSFPLNSIPCPLFNLLIFTQLIECVKECFESNIGYRRQSVDVKIAFKCDCWKWFQVAFPIELNAFVFLFFFFNVFALCRAQHESTSDSQTIAAATTINRDAEMFYVFFFSLSIFWTWISFVIFLDWYWFVWQWYWICSH